MLNRLSLLPDAILLRKRLTIEMIFGFTILT